MTIYLIPGIGCDQRLFDRISTDGHDVIKLEWPDFPIGCTLADIARDMSTRVEATKPHILIGVSMGGMVAQELAAITKPEKVILISSWTGPQEWPMAVKVAALLRAHHLISHFAMWLTWPIKRTLGWRDGATDKLLWDMANKQTARKIRRGTGAILRWKGSPWKGKLVRIHGDRDQVIPLRFPVDHVLLGGAHIMVLTQAEEVSRLLRKAITA